ncbi:UNVERIFIED_CONTAM: 50S ribosomal protein L18 [Sesamum indicum]
MGVSVSYPPSSFSLSSELFSSRRRDGPNSLSWSSSFPDIKLLTPPISIPSPSPLTLNQGLIVQAAWTRRSRSEAAKKPNRKSWKQRTDMYMRPFLLNVFFSKRFVHAKVMHRGTSKVISVATTNAKDLRNTLPSLTDNNACRVIGKLIAERSKEADVHAIAYELKKNERVEGRLAIILDTIQENGILPYQMKAGEVHPHN